MVASLEAQVAVLLEERDDLATQITRVTDDAHAAKRRARAMVDAVVEQAFS